MAGRRRRVLPKELFVSHSSRDHAFVEKLVDVLRRHKIRVWYSPKEILGADEWHDEIGKALARCDWFALIISQNAAKSMWVKRELRYALQDRRYGDRIVPILYKTCDYARTLSWTLTSFQFVDFRRTFRGGCRDLLKIWGKELIEP